MDKRHLYISTIADDAVCLAEKYKLGLEIAEFCTAYNMDDRYAEVEPQVNAEFAASDRFVFHAPFNELFPSAIDPKAVELAHTRLNQAVILARSYGIKRIVMHSGNAPQLYFPSWFEERSIIFWHDFLRDKPDDLLICVENVLENEPTVLCHIVEAVGDPRLKLCLDVGHANSSFAKMGEKIPLDEWLEAMAPHIAHFHIHNNTGEFDMHNNLGDGGIDMQRLLSRAEALCLDATYTIETMHAAPSVEWLITNNFIGK